MLSIPDDPIISCIERTGYPQWMLDEINGSEEDEKRGDELFCD